jgi:large subunit ribosomal protein L13
MVKKEEVRHNWYLVDVKGKVLGRAVTRIAGLLMGKDKTDFTPNVDNGDGVVVVNCDKVRVTGNKSTRKGYKRYSGYPGGQKVTRYEEMKKKDPGYIIRHAVKGMLPKNRLGARMLKRLKLYTGTEHSQTAQKPEKVEI